MCLIFGYEIIIMSGAAMETGQGRSRLHKGWRDQFTHAYTPLTRHREEAILFYKEDWLITFKIKFTQLSSGAFLINLVKFCFNS